MNTVELKKLAEAATPGPWIAGYDEDSDYFLVGPHDGDSLVSYPVVTLHSEANATYIAAANPAAISKLLAINAALGAALKVANAHVLELCTVFGIPLPDDSIEKISAALAKAEGGEL